MSKGSDAGGFLATYGTALAAAILFCIFAVAAPNFLNPTNLLNVLKQVSFLAILGLGFGLALITGELDLSFANVCSFAVVVVGGLIHHGYAPALAVAGGLAVGAAAGTLNGVLVTRLKIPSLIATLATASVANGLAFAVTGGVAFVGRWDPAFLALGRGSVLGVPALILWTAGAALLAAFLLKHTRLGLHMIFTGEADEAARLSGIDVRRTKLLGLLLLGIRGGPRCRAADRHAQFRRAQHGERLPVARDRRGPARHDDVRARPLQRRRHARRRGDDRHARQRPRADGRRVLRAGHHAWRYHRRFGRAVGVDAQESRIRRLAQTATTERPAIQGRIFRDQEIDCSNRRDDRIDRRRVVGARVQARHHRVPDVVGDACAGRQRRGRSGQGPGLAGADPELRRQPAEARRADRSDDPGEGRRPDHRHGQAGRGRCPARRGQKAGIPVITTVAGTSPHTLFDIQVNDYQIGAQATLYLLSKINYSGAILTERYENNVASRIRGKVLDVVLSENPSVKVLGSHSMARTASWQEDVRSGMQALILRNQGKFQGVWASFDGQAYVIDDLLKAQGLKKGDVVLVSIDGGPESYRRIKAPDSLLTATVGIPFERIGRTAVEKMNDIVVKKVPKNQAVNGPYLWMDAVLVDASNVDQMLK